MKKQTEKLIDLLFKEINVIGKNQKLLADAIQELYNDVKIIKERMEASKEELN